MAFLCTFDGPKGVGKSTVIGEVAARLHRAGWTVSVQVEKEVLHALCGASLTEAHARFRENPSLTSEKELASRYMFARVAASAGPLANNPAQIILLDRWYPSDAVFRTHIDSAEVIKANLHAGVRRPDLAIAVTCAPAISWRRAHQRARRLDSQVISSLADHEVSTIRFEAAAEIHGWCFLRTDSTSPAALGETVERLIDDELVLIGELLSSRTA